MSQANVEIVRAQFDSASLRDYRAAQDAFAEDVVPAVNASAVPTNAGTFCGLEGCRELVRGLVQFVRGLPVRDRGDSRGGSAGVRGYPTSRTRTSQRGGPRLVPRLRLHGSGAQDRARRDVCRPRRSPQGRGSGGAGDVAGELMTPRASPVAGTLPARPGRFERPTSRSGGEGEKWGEGPESRTDTRGFAPSRVTVAFADRGDFGAIRRDTGQRLALSAAIHAHPSVPRGATSTMAWPSTRNASSTSCPRRSWLVCRLTPSPGWSVSAASALSLREVARRWQGCHFAAASARRSAGPGGSPGHSVGSPA